MPEWMQGGERKFPNILAKNKEWMVMSLHGTEYIPGN